MHSLAMILFQRHYDIVFIQVLILCANSPSLFGEHIIRDTSEIYDDSQIKAEEIVRRRKLIQPHLLQIAEEQKEWIETYHMTFDAHETIPRKKVESSSNDLMKDPIQTEISSLDLNEKILKQETFLDYSGKSVVPETSFLDPEKVHRLRIVEDYVPKLKNLEMGIGLDHVDSTVMGSVASSSNSVGAKYIVDSDEIKRHSEEYVSVNKFTDSSAQELTEINKYKIESEPSTSYSYKQDIGFVLRENIKLTESKRVNVDFNLKQNLETGNLNTKHSVLPELHLNHNNIYRCSGGSMKDNFLHVIKELTDLKVIEPNMCDVLPLNEIPSNKNHEVDQLIIKAKNTEPVKFKKNDNLGLTEKSSTVPKGLHIRQEYVKSYMSSLDKGKEYWKETFDFSFQKIDSEESFQYAPVLEDSRYLSGNLNEVSKNIADVKSWERLYFHRWLKKILNKLIGHPYTEHVNIVFSFSPDCLNQLQKLSTSEKYEISYVDELISDLISNATISYDHNIYSFYASISPIHFYIIVSILLSVILFFVLMYHPYLKVLLIMILCIMWHTYKMYAEKVAEKHAILSASSSEYCESILNKESGIFAHIKEFVRYSFYNDHCKKYFEALMIDPISELSLSIVVSDFVSSTFFQLFRPMARALNLFVKDAFEDLSFFQTFYGFFILGFVFIFVISLVLIYNRYKVNFPFFMGSIEPTIPLRGSRVEDIPLESKRKKSLPEEKNELKSIIKRSPLKIVETRNNDKLIINHNFSLKHLQDDPQTKTHQSLKRRLSC